MIGAGPRLGCLPPAWIMIAAGPRLGLGLGHRFVESADALVPGPRRGLAPTMIHLGSKHPRL